VTRVAVNNNDNNIYTPKVSFELKERQVPQQLQQRLLRPMFSFSCLVQARATTTATATTTAHTYPCSRPDVWAELKDWQLKHKVNSGDELCEATDRIEEATNDVKYVTHSPAATKSQTWKQKEIKRNFTFFVLNFLF